MVSAICSTKKRPEIFINLEHLLQRHGAVHVLTATFLLRSVLQ